jgi:hypothetical protein
VKIREEQKKDKLFVAWYGLQTRFHFLKSQQVGRE